MCGTACACDGPTSGDERSSGVTSDRTHSFVRVVRREKLLPSRFFSVHVVYTLGIPTGLDPKVCRFNRALAEARPTRHCVSRDLASRLAGRACGVARAAPPSAVKRTFVARAEPDARPRGAPSMCKHVAHTRHTTLEAGTHDTSPPHARAPAAPRQRDSTAAVWRAVCSPVSVSCLLSRP